MLLETFLFIGYCGDMVTEAQLWPLFIDVDKDGESLVLRIFGRLNHGEGKRRLRTCGWHSRHVPQNPVLVKVAPRRISPEYDTELVADRAMADYAETHPYAPTTTRKGRVNYQNN